MVSEIADWLSAIGPTTHRLILQERRDGRIQLAAAGDPWQVIRVSLCS
jgi:hypothetical protein